MNKITHFSFSASILTFEGINRNKFETSCSEPVMGLNAMAFILTLACIEVNFKMEKYMFILILIVSSLPGISQYGSIDGHVYNIETKRIIPYARVIIPELMIETEANSDGYYKIDSLKPGVYRINIFSTCTRINQYLPFDVVPDSTKTIDAYLSKVPCEYEKSLKYTACPICGETDKIVPIVYGLYSETIDTTLNYYPGGKVSCCDPNWYCRRDKCKY